MSLSCRMPPRQREIDGHIAGRQELERIVDFMQFRCKERSVPAGRERQNGARQNRETALVLAAKSGDGQAFEILIKRYQGRILAVAKRFTHIREDAEDIVQQSLQKAFVHLHKFEAKSSFSTWLRESRSTKPLCCYAEVAVCARYRSTIQVEMKKPHSGWRYPIHALAPKVPFYRVSGTKFYTRQWIS